MLYLCKLIGDVMHKLTTDEMNRLTAEEFRASEKLPLTVVLDNVRSQKNIGSVFLECVVG